MHAEPAEVFAGLGYHILLEKPMAPDEAACRRIVAAVEKAGVMLAVGHVMRYTPYTGEVSRKAPATPAGRLTCPSGGRQPARRAEIHDHRAERRSCGCTWTAAALHPAPERRDTRT
jgi:GFO/IDH/MocA oxidoreductase family protein